MAGTRNGLRGSSSDNRERGGSALQSGVKVCFSVGHGGQARLADRPSIVHAGHASLRSLVAPVQRSRCTHAWDQGLESLALGRAWGRSRHFRLHPSRRPRGTIRPGSSGGWVSAHAAASDPCRKSEPSTHMRWRRTAILRATATIARRRPFVFISRTPQALRLYQAIDRISMALAAA